jgi:phosphoenolpyruvate---glycerone phosphotransferase subunit DhaK
MKKIINKPENFVDETMAGIRYAYGDRVTFLNGDNRILIKNTPTPDGKVGIVTAGGSGHLPVFLGYVGQGMIDGCAVGNVFASPSASKMASMIEACNYGSGVLCLYGNYGGDNLNFDMAIEEAEFSDIKTATIRVKDDVASSPKESAGKRRGVAGMVYAFKIAGAAADNMMDLDGVVQTGYRKGAGQYPHHGRCTYTRALCRKWANPPSPSKRTRWKLAWAFTANQGYRWEN